MTKSPAYRAPLIDTLLDFTDEKLREAIDDPMAAATEAAGVMPFIGERLREDEVILTNFVLLLDVRLDRRHGREWWDNFARLDHGAFSADAANIIDRIGVLRRLLRGETG
jgi:hypothetical protein